MRKLLLFLFSTTNVNFSLLIISCDSEIAQATENQAFLTQNDEKTMQQFINEVKKLNFDLLESVSSIDEIQIIVLNKLNSFIKENEKYQNISFTIEKISKTNKDDYIISYLPLSEKKQHIKFASTLTVTINNVKKTFEAKSEIEDEKDQLEVQIPTETVDKIEETDVIKSLPSTYESSNHENDSVNFEQPFNSANKETIEEINLPTIQDQQIKPTSESKTSQIFSSDYQEKFNVLQQEIKIKEFEYDFAQTTYSYFITTILKPWLNQRLTNLNYKLDLVYDLWDEIMGNTIANVSLNITFNDEENTKQHLSIQVNCKEKATKAHSILNYVWTELENLQRQKIQFEDLPSRPNYNDIVKRFESKLKSGSANYQNIAFIFKGVKGNGDKTVLLKKGDNKIEFTLAVDNKSFFHLWVNYFF